LYIPIEGIKAEVRQRDLIIRFASPLRALSSSVLNRSYSRFSAIVNKQVAADCDHAKIRELFFDTVKRLGLSGRVLGLITAVDVNNMSIVNKAHSKLTVCAVVTAGVLNPASAGDSAPEETRNSTINIILFIDGNLTQHCMVNSVMTATEAKSAALRDLDIRSSLSMELATGTTSDMIAVACTGKGRPLMFAGTATKLGELIGGAVKEAVKSAIRKQHGITPDRLLLKRLEERGIEFDLLLDSALELYSQQFNKRAKKVTIQSLTHGLKNALMDANISALVLAGLRLHEDYHRGLIPNLSVETPEQNYTFLNAGQMLGKTLANCMAGPTGVQTFLKFSKENPGILRELAPIANDVFKGLFAGLSSEILAKK